MLTFKEKVIAGEGRNHVCIWKTANEHSWHNALVGARTHSSHTHTLVAPSSTSTFPRPVSVLRSRQTAMSHVRMQRIQYPPPPVEERGQHVTDTMERVPARDHPMWQPNESPRSHHCGTHWHHCSLDLVIDDGHSTRRCLLLYGAAAQPAVHASDKKNMAPGVLLSSLASTLTPLLEYVHMTVGRPSQTWAGIAFHRLTSALLLRWTC